MRGGSWERATGRGKRRATYFITPATPGFNPADPAAAAAGVRGGGSALSRSAAAARPGKPMTHMAHLHAPSRPSGSPAGPPRAQGVECNPDQPCKQLRFLRGGASRLPPTAHGLAAKPNRFRAAAQGRGKPRLPLAGAPCGSAGAHGAPPLNCDYRPSRRRRRAPHDHNSQGSRRRRRWPPQGVTPRNFFRSAAAAGGSNPNPSSRESPG